MSGLIKDDQWVWVVVQDPGKDEKFLGQHDEEKGISFIPIFLAKEEAQKCLFNLKTERGRHYEAQAILYEDLKTYSLNEGFMLFILNGNGEVLEKIY